MADDNHNNTPSSPPAGGNRRSSFAGDTFASIFGTRRSNSVSDRHSQNSSENANASQPTQQYPGPISTAAAQAQRRRLSLTTLGLSGSPNQTSPFNSYRRESGGSANSGSIDESAIEDDVGASAPVPHTPFGRRMSFGAKALRDVRNSTGGSGGGGGGGGGEQTAPTGTRKPSTHATQQQPHISSRSSGDAKGRGLCPLFPSISFFCISISLFPPPRLLTSSHLSLLPTTLILTSSTEGFNWSDNFSTRAQRTSSIATAAHGSTPPSAHSRAKSVAVMEEAPIPKEMPKPKEPNRPDHFQERILKGDFYMD